METHLILPREKQTTQRKEKQKQDDEKVGKATNVKSPLFQAGFSNMVGERG